MEQGGPFDNVLSKFNGYVGEVAGGLGNLIFGTYAGGINKDSLACDWSPHYALHPDAVDAAEAASAQYINDIKPKLTDQQLRLLFGVGTTLAFVMDTTGSMSDIQSSVAAQAIQIATDRLATNDQVDLYVISLFNDPTTGPVTSVTNISSFEAIMDGLTASGGGDCPELSLTGILNAIDAVDEDAQVFMFTDAAAKDADLAEDVTTAALAKQVNVNIFKFDSSCDDGLEKRVDHESDVIYGEVAAGTGGTYHSLPRDQVNSISGLLDTLTTSETSYILKIADSLDTIPGGTRSYTFPVDSLMTQLAISLRGSSATVTYTHPGSIPAADITTVTLTDGSFVTIKPPTAGTWTITVKGSGSFTLDITGTSPLYFTSFEFVASTGRGGHDGYFPISEQPPFNTPIGIIANLYGAFSSATFDFRAPEGSELLTLPVTAGSGEYGFPSSSSFFGIVTMPPDSGFVYAFGVDGAGAPFQRLLSTVISQVISNVTYDLGTLDPIQYNNTLNGTSSNSSSSTVPTSAAKYSNTTHSTSTAKHSNKTYSTYSVT